MTIKYETVDGFKLAWIGAADIESIALSLSRGDIHGLGVNPYSGWDGAPDDFARLPTSIRALAVPFGDRVQFKQYHLDRFTSLEFLWISESKERWKVSSSELRVLRLDFDRVIVFDDTRNLSLIGVFRLGKTWTSSKMPRAPKVERIEINQGNCTSLDCIAEYARLRQIEVSNLRKLESIDVLAGMSGLEYVRIESCKSIQRLEQVIGALPSLRKLHLVDCGELPSIGFVQGLALEEFLLGRTMVLDGDLSVLDSIGTVAFDNQLHYNRKSEDLLPRNLRYT